jgi:hypothetical protein
MTLKQSGIEGFADGVAIGTVGAGSGEDAFNTAATNPGGVGAQRHANAANKLFGDVAAKFSTSTTAATAIIGWSWTSSTTTSFRSYVKFSGNPPSTLRFLKLIRSSGNSFELALTTSRQIRILNISAATVDTFSAISLNTWYRIEGTVTHGASTGAATVSIYRWDESEPIQTKSVSNQAFTGPCTGFQVGVLNSLANVPEFFVDGLGADDSGASIGPVSGSLNDPPTLSLAGTLVNLGTTTVTMMKGQTARITATAADPEAAGALSYAWSVVSQPSGATLDLTGITADHVDVSPTHAGDTVIRCTVTDAGSKVTSVDTTVVCLPLDRV